MSYLFSTKKTSGCISSDSLEVVECKNWYFYSKNLSLKNTQRKFFSVEEIIDIAKKNCNTYFLLIAVNKKNNEILVFNDSLGTNDIFLYEDVNEGTILVSESVFTLPISKEDISLENIQKFLAFGAVNPPQTIYNNTFKIPTGVYAVVSGKDFKLNRYFDIKDLFAPKSKSYSDLVESLRTSFIDFLGSHSDKKVGVSLSGGIDSGGILAILNKELRQEQVKSVTLGPYGVTSGDLNSSRLTVSENNSNNSEVYPDVKDIAKIPHFMRSLSQPVDTNFVFSMGLVLDVLAKENTEVVYFGIGVDNMLGVSLHHKYLYQLNTLNYFLPRIVKQLLLFASSRVYTLSKNRVRILLESNPERRLLFALSAHYAYEQSAYKTKFDVYLQCDFDCNQTLESIFKETSLSLVDKMIYADWIYYYTYSLNGSAVSLGNRFGVKSLSPMYSPSVLNSLLKTTLGFRKKSGWGKQIVRDMYQPFVSERLYKNAPKSSAVNFNKWIKGNETEVIKYIASSPLLNNLVDLESVSKALSTHPDPVSYLVKLLGLAVWYDVNWNSDNLSHYESLVSRITKNLA